MHVTLLGNPVTSTIDGSGEIELRDRSQDATHIRLRITCTFGVGLGG